MTDTIQQILDWHHAACPEPGKKEISVQVGCHYEEIAEMFIATNNHEEDATYYAEFYKGKYGHENIANFDKLALLDSLCDQIVTALGVGYRMGFDMAGALTEVARSNDSKMVDGAFQYDKNGKVIKPEGYSPPDLMPFIGAEK